MIKDIKDCLANLNVNLRLFLRRETRNLLTSLPVLCFPIPATFDGKGGGGGEDLFVIDGEGSTPGVFFFYGGTYTECRSLLELNPNVGKKSKRNRWRSRRRLCF